MSKPLILKKKIVMDDVQQRKMELLNQIQLQQDAIVALSKDIISPPQVSGPSFFVFGNSLLNKFNRGVVIFDGIMVGVKLFRGIKRLFRRR